MKVRKKLTKEEEQELKEEAGLQRDSNGKVVIGALNKKYTIKEARNRFHNVLEKCYEGDVLSLHECVVLSGMSRTKFEEFAGQYPEFSQLKAQMKTAIISNINRGALTGKYHPVAAIFRQKVLGEQDRQVIDVTTNKEQPIINIDDFQ